MIQNPLTVDKSASGHQTRFFYTVILLISFFLSLLLFTSKSYANTQRALLVLGDSISAGYGMSRDQSWVTLLERRLAEQGYEYKVVNASISGETTQGGLTRLPELLRQHKPELVLLELGGNDGLRGFSLHLVRTNISQMIDMSRKQGATPLLLGIQLPPNYGRRYTQAFAEVYPKLGKEKAVPVVPFILENIALYPELMQDDGIHPKAAAQLQLLDNIWPTLKPLLR